MHTSEFLLVPTLRVGMPPRRSASGPGTRSVPPAFPRGAWEREQRETRKINRLPTGVHRVAQRERGERKYGKISASVLITKVNFFS